MLRFFIVVLFLVNFAHAQMGEVRYVRKANDAWMSRNGSRLNLNEGMTLQEGDAIHTENAYVTIFLYPKIQMSLISGTQLTITQHLLDQGNDQTTSVIDFIKGVIRIKVIRDASEKIDQKVQTRFATFAVRGTEYEVSATEQDSEVDVFEGQVEVTSPKVKGPELVKANQGLRIGSGDVQFTRRPVKERVQDARFLSTDEVRDRWEKLKAQRLIRKLEHERHNGLKEKKLENVKDRVEKMLDRKENLDDE